jgi:hypothetical protein
MPEQREKYSAPDPNAPPDNRPKATPQPGTRAGRPQGDGRRDPGQMKRNQEHLRVGDDHKTPEMKKHRRGTFP